MSESWSGYGLGDGVSSGGGALTCNSAGNLMLGTTTAPDSSGKNFSLCRGTAGLPTGSGLIRLTDIETDAAAKQAAISVRNQTNSEEDNCIFYASTAGLNLGGGVSALNAMTSITFYTAANATTTSGTSRGSIDTNGKWTIGTSGTAQIQAIHTALATNGADAATIANGPAGTAGNPDIWFKIGVNGTDYCVPAWTFT